MKKFRKPTVLLAFLSLTICLAGMVRAEEKGAAKSVAPFSVKVTGSGRPMILIPGLSCGGDVWDQTVAHFKGHYECHVLTLAGFAGQPAIGEPMLENIRTGLEKYIREKKLDHPVVVGHSLGGFMAFWLAAKAPDQVGAIIAVDGLPFLPAIFDPNATVESSKGFAESYRSKYDSVSQEEFAANNRKFLESMITDVKDVEAVNTFGKKSDPKAVGLAFYELMTTDLRPLVKAIKTPVLLIGATASNPDPQARATVEGIYQQQVSTIAKHKVVFAPKARHFIQLDEPEFFYAQVESFLKDSDASKAK